MTTIGLYAVRDVRGEPHPRFVHDHSLAVLEAGRVRTVVPLERHTRRKHDNRLDQHLPGLLTDLLAPDEPARFVCVNSFAGDAVITADGSLRVEPLAPVGISAEPVRARVRWFPDGARPRETEGWAICHEWAHLASLLPFVGAFEPDSLLVHIDGGASASASSFWTWDGRRARLLQASWDGLKTPLNNFNDSPLVRSLLGFGLYEHLSIPGKLMGYAGLGQPSPRILAWLDEHHFFLDAPDDPNAILEAINRGLGAGWSELDPRHPLAQDIAATLQAHFEAQVSGAILDWQRRTGARHLYYAGGAGLNIPTNAALEQSGAFRSVHVPPCTNDTGLALGAAAWLEFQERGALPFHGPFLCGHQVDMAPTDLALVPALARLLADGAVLGLCEGAAEIGPRALGHRSILARPDRPSLRQRVSKVIKRREWYRPVAPVLLDAVAVEALGPEVARSALAPYMLGAWPVRPGWREHFAGVQHADGTVRAQVVRRDDPDLRLLAALLDRLWTEHGIAGLINTSFNGPGEPIVHRPGEALETAARLGLDGVVVHGSLHRL